VLEWRQRQLKSSEYEVVELLTTITEGYDRISMHGVRRELVEEQASAIGIPMQQVRIPPQCVNDTYQSRMRDACLAYKARGINHMAFGDLFLRDIRDYRDKMLAIVGMHALYPLWDRPTAALARDFIAQGYKATLCCVDPAQIAPHFCGHAFDAELLATLPPTADPCGENGEFHTFVTAAPYFSRSLSCIKGETVLRDNFWFCDLYPNIPLKAHAS